MAAQLGGSRDPAAFGTLLRRHRQAAALTQAELADRAGLGERTVSNLERGINRAPYPSTVRLLADALGISEGPRAELVRAARGTAAADGESRLPVGGHLGARPSSRLVARDAERTAIVTAVTDVAAGHGRVLLLAGEPGIGKTRLAQESGLLAGEQRFTVATGRCFQPQIATPFGPLYEIFAALYDDAPTRLREQVEQRWPTLATLLPENFASYVASTRPAPEDAQRLSREATAFVRTLAVDRPVALLVDDLHWADSASVDLLAHLARHTREDRVLILGTYRTAEVGRMHRVRELGRSLAREGIAHTITVDRLDPDATTRLITDQLDDSPVSEEFAALIYRHTDGNPFFTVETLMALIERGDLSRIDGRWVRRELTDLKVPASVSDAIAERASRLAPATQDLLEALSVLGEVVDVEDLAILDLDDDELERSLDEAVASGLLTTAGDRYAFDHVLTQQALYGGLSPVRRRRLHRLAGEDLERRPEPVRRRRPGDIARHLEAGGAPDRAAAYVLLAGDGAAAVHAHGEALQHYRRALDLAQEVDDVPAQAQALERIGQVLMSTGRYDESVEHLDLASARYRLAEDPGSRLRVEGTIAQVLHRRGTSRAAADRLVDVVAEIDPPSTTHLQDPGVATLLRGLALVRLSLGEPDLALEAAERAARVARDHDEAPLKASVGVALGTILLYADRPAEAVDVLEGAVAEARAVDAVTSESDGLMALQWALLMQGQPGRGRTFGHRGLELAERTGDTVAASQHHAGVGLNLFYTGDWAQAEHHLERGVELARSHSTLFSPIAPSYLGLVRRGRGDLTGAAACYAEAAASPDLQTFAFDAYVDARRAELDLAQGDPATALSRLEPWVAQDPPTRIHDPMLLATAAEACLGLGDAVRGEELARRAILRARATNNRVDGVDAVRVRGLSLLQQDRHDEARTCLDEALTHAAALPHPAAEARTLRDLARLSAHAGDAVAAEQQRQAARAIFARLGAAHELAELAT